MFQEIIHLSKILLLVPPTIFGIGGATAQAQIWQPASDGLVSRYRAEGDAANVPQNLAAWHAGDSDTRYFTGANDGKIVFPETKFIVGKVGQAFAFDVGNNGIGGGVQLSRSVFRGQSEGTIETWVRLRGMPVGTFGVSAIWAEIEESFGIRFGIFYDRDGQIVVSSNFSNALDISQKMSSGIFKKNERRVIAAHFPFVKYFRNDD
jgi:hypothetical protein